jgi:hypothetical protein
MMTLLEEIQAKCASVQIAEGNFHVLAEIVSVGRTKPNNVEIGNGTILEVLGLALGTAVLDAIHATPSYKYVLPLLDQGRLKIGSSVAQEAVQAFVTVGMLDQTQADKLKTLGLDPDPVSWEQCRAAVQGE